MNPKSCTTAKYVEQEEKAKAEKLQKAAVVVDEEPAKPEAEQAGQDQVESGEGREPENDQPETEND